MPLKAARRCQDLHPQVAEMAPLVQVLRRAGVHGTTFDQATAQAEQLQDSLAQLPGWCTLDKDDLVLQQATKASTIRAWQRLDDLEEPVGEQRATFERWHTVHQEIGEGLQAMQHALDQARARLARVPGSIDVADRALQLNGLEALPIEMQARYRAPTVQDLEAIHPQIPPAIERTYELGAFFESIVRTVEHLRGALDANARLVRETQAQMDALAQAPEYPIDWESYRDTLAGLYHVRDSIGALADRRTPERLDEHVKLADALTGQGQALKLAVEQARNARMALLPLLSRPELGAQPTWLTKARHLRDQVSTYGPDNWAEELEAPSVLSDAQALEQRRQQWVPASVHTALPVTQLDARLQGMRKLVDELASFQRRLDRIDAQLLVLQKARQTARQDLQRAHQAVERLLPLIRHATPPIGRSRRRHRRQLERAHEAGRKLIADLDRQGTESIESKAKEIGRWTKTCQKALGDLLTTVYAQAKSLEANLQDAVSELRSVASFDQEGAMQEALRQLDIERPDAPPFSSSRDPTASQVVALVDDTIETLQDREDLYETLGSLGAQIKNRIEGQRAAATQARQEARAGYEALLDRKRQSEHAWPPLQCDTRLADNRLAFVERDEQTLRSSGRTVHEVTHSLERIAQGYASLSAEVQSKIGQNTWERQQVQERWDRVGRWQTSLTNYGRAHRQEPDLANAARRWSHDTDREAQRVQRSHGRSPMTHEQAMQMLDDLWARVYERTMPVRGQSAPLQARDIEREFPI